MIIRSAVERPVTVLMLFAGLVLIGVLASRRLPVDLLPAINYPNLTVITTFPDTPPEDLARLVAQPLEEVIAGLAGVRRVTSRTREGVCAITAEYEWGMKMDFANLHLREALDRVAFRDDFPHGADRPLILRWDPGARPIAVMAMGGDAPLSEATDFAREVVKPALEQIRGISQAEVIGGAEREVLVRPDFTKLRLFGLTMEQLSAALQIANVTFPGGRIRRGPLHLPLRMLGEFETLDDIRATEIPSAGPGVTIGSVATVIDTLKEPDGITLLGDREVVSLHLYKEVGANTVTAMKEVDRVMGILKGQYPQLSHTFVYRDDRYVQESFRGLRDSLGWGALLAFAVLFVFLHDLRSPLVVGLAIPVSVFATFAFLYFAKVNLNLMSLGGLSLAAGMLVDNSIVVLENISRYVRGSRPGRGGVAEITATATQEVALPVVASTLTTVAVFFPVIYVPGIAGEFFRDQALTVTCALLVSILSALLLQPMLSARLLNRVTEPRGPFRSAETAFQTFAERYHRLLVLVMGHKTRFLLCLGIATLVSVAVGSRLRAAFLPERNQGDFTATVELPAGTPLEHTARTVGRLSRLCGEMPEVAAVYAQVGQTERTVTALKEYAASNTARIRVLLHPAREGRERSNAVRARLAEAMRATPGLSFVFRDEGIGLREILGGDDAPFAVGVVAERAEDARVAAEALAIRLEAVRGLVDVETDRVLGNPTIQLSIDREEALRRGIEPEAVARELRARVRGVVATTFNEVEQRIDISVRLAAHERRDLAAVLASPVRGDHGAFVPLGALLTQSEIRPVREVVRTNQRRQITVRGNVKGRSLGGVWKEVRTILADMPLPAGATFVTGGEQEEIRQSFRDLAWALLLSVLLVYMILAAQFESFLDPLIMSAVLPVGVMGSLLTLFVTGQSLNVISLIGLIALIGIGVNDAIVKVATIRRLRKEGQAGRVAILEASRLRLRPILMTTVTTVCGMMPMAIGIGTGEQIQRPLALTIIGGLSITTALTLFLTPVLYEIIHARFDRDYATGRDGHGSPMAVPTPGGES